MVTTVRNQEEPRQGDILHPERTRKAITAVKSCRKLWIGFTCDMKSKMKLHVGEDTIHQQTVVAADIIRLRSDRRLGKDCMAIPEITLQ